MDITEDLLVRTIRATRARAGPWAIALHAATNLRGIQDPRHVAAFLAEIAHTSERFARMDEAYRVSADRLARLYPRAFPTLRLARQYEGNQQAIASRVYAGINGNGDEASGDGWAYRPRGLIRVKGRNAYAQLGAAIGVDLVGNPDALAQPDAAAGAAAWKWQDIDGNAYVDADDFNGLTRVLHGNLEGQTERVALWKLAREALGVPVEVMYPKAGPSQP